MAPWPPLEAPADDPGQTDGQVHDGDVVQLQLCPKNQQRSTKQVKKTEERRASGVHPISVAF